MKFIKTALVIFITMSNTLYAQSSGREIPKPVRSVQSICLKKITNCAATNDPNYPYIWTWSYRYILEEEVNYIAYNGTIASVTEQNRFSTSQAANSQTKDLTIRRCEEYRDQTTQLYDRCS
jgi:hypothetical protein